MSNYPINWHNAENEVETITTVQSEKFNSQECPPYEFNVEYAGYCRALYDYAGRDEFELSFSSGDIIKIVERDYDTGWWTGELNGRTALIPSNYITEDVSEYQ
jgi:hypothetical protein